MRRNIPSTRCCAATFTAPAIHQFGAVTYYNCGDWVETCSALIERENGAIELVNCHPFPGLCEYEHAQWRSLFHETRNDDYVDRK